MSEYVIKNDEGEPNHPRYFYIVEAMVNTGDFSVDIKWSWDIEEAKRHTLEQAENSIGVIELCLPSIVGQLSIVEVNPTYEDYNRAMSIIQ